MLQVGEKRAAMQLSVRQLTEKNSQLREEFEKRKKTVTKLAKSKRVLQSAIVRLKATQSNLIQSEKLASVGHLAAGIAHEINNPTAFVSSNLKTAEGYLKAIGAMVAAYRQSIALLEKSARIACGGDQAQSILDAIERIEESTDIDFILADLADIFAECRQGTDRIQKIVADLKDFARPGEPGRQLADVNQCLDATINIVWNELKDKAALIKEYGDLPRINCYCQEINQVFMNLLVNAGHAIEKQGTIRVRTCLQGDNIEVHISDTGSGIAPKDLPKIFDPFFTTKDIGKGTGLGLSTVYGIVKKHNGKILVESEVRKGTHFTIILPAAVHDGLPAAREKFMGAIG